MSFEKLFTSSGTPKIIDVLREYQNTDLTLTGIANKAGVRYTIRLKALPLLERRGIVIMTQRVGNARFYGSIK